MCIKLFCRHHLHVLLCSFLLLGFYSTSKAIEASPFIIVDTKTDKGYDDIEIPVLHRQRLPEKYSIIMADWAISNEAKSAVFFVNGEKVRTESVRPFSLGSDKDGDFFPYELPIGSGKIVVDFYPEKYGQGEKIQSLSTHVYIIGTSVVFDKPEVNLQVSAGEQAQFSFQMVIEQTNIPYEIKEANLYPSWISSSKPIQEGENTIQVDASSLTPGIYNANIHIRLKSLEIPSDFPYPGLGVFFNFSAHLPIQLEVTPSNNLFIPKMTLVDATKNEDICQEFSEFSGLNHTFSFDLYCLPDQLSVRADAYNQPGSVVFEYAFSAPGEDEKPLSYFRTENIEPYALFGDSPKNDFIGIPKKPGLYKIRATPFSEPHGKGEAGKSMEISFTIVPRPLPSIRTFQIVGSSNNAISCLGDITSHHTFYLGEYCLPDSINIIANTDGFVGRVDYEYSYTAPGEEEHPLKHFSKEYYSPYSLFGDFPRGNFAGIPTKPGLYKVRATPYTEKQDQAGIPLEVSIIIISQGNEQLSTNKSIDLNNMTENIEFLDIYPNPLTQSSRITYQSTYSGFVSFELFDLRGNLIRRIYQGNKQVNQKLSFKLDRQGLQAGYYILRKQTDDGVKIQRIKVE